jgi:hypothetical protein
LEGLNTVGHAINNEKSYLDAGCKALLGCTAVAAFIVKNCIPEFHDMSLEEIQEYIIYKKAKSQMTPEELAEIQAENTSPVEIGCHIVDDLPDKLNEKNVESKSTNEGTIYYDVLFDIGMPDGKSPPSRVIVDIEAQNEFKPGYAILKRGSFYCGRMISAQKETVFRNSDYNKLQKVYSIWLCIAPDEDVRGVCNAYNMSEICLAKEHHFPKEQYDNFCIILACLQDKQSANNMVRFFSSVFDNEMPVEEKLDLARECGLQVTADVKEGINQMCNYSDYVEQKGIEKGRIEALSESVVKLVREGNYSVEAATNLLPISDDIRATVKANAEKILNNK